MYLWQGRTLLPTVLKCSTLPQIHLLPQEIWDNIIQWMKWSIWQMAKRLFTGWEIFSAQTEKHWKYLTRFPIHGIMRVLLVLRFTVPVITQYINCQVEAFYIAVETGPQVTVPIKNA